MFFRVRNGKKPSAIIAAFFVPTESEGGRTTKDESKRNLRGGIAHDMAQTIACAELRNHKISTRNRRLGGDQCFAVNHHFSISKTAPNHATTCSLGSIGGADAAPRSACEHDCLQEIMIKGHISYLNAVIIVLHYLQTLFKLFVQVVKGHSLKSGSIWRVHQSYIMQYSMNSRPNVTTPHDTNRAEIQRQF